jgi:hypothetical protein
MKRNPDLFRQDSTAEAIFFPSRILVSRHLYRPSLTYGYDGETVILADDPLDIIDEVLRHTGTSWTRRKGTSRRS